ncbi:MAG TPA: dockerin type I domain-containing protein [Pirellulales bacterium]
MVNGNLTLAGSLSVSALTGFGAGIYELFSYTGSLIDSGLSLGTLPTGFSYKLDETSTPGQILLDVTSLASLTGDVNGDGIVNGQDLALVSSNWLHAGSGVTGDVNHDGIVNGQDLALVSSNWLHTSGAGAPVTTSGVPEPGSFALLALGLASAAVRRRTTRRGSVNEEPKS